MWSSARRRCALVLASALVLATLSVATYGAAGDDDIAVDVRLDGPAVRVSVDCPVTASPTLVWDSRGLLTFTFENVRELDLVPGREVHSRLVSGDLKESEFLTQIVEQGGVVHILNSGRFIPNMWVPPLIGPPIIAAETRKQFGEIRTEILRRQTLAAAAGSMPTPAPAP